MSSDEETTTGAEVKAPKAKEVKKRKSTSPQEAKKQSLLQRSASGIVLLISVLLAYGGGRYVRTSIHEWVDKTLRDLMPGKPSPTMPRIWAVTPNSTGLKVDAAIYEEFLGSQMTMLEKRPPPREDGQDDNKCVYLFLEVTPKTPKADMHRDWAPLAKGKQKRKKSHPPCRVMAMANTDQFTVDMLDLPHLELILCKTRQCVSWIQEKQKDRPKQISILYTGFTSRSPPLPSSTSTSTLVKQKKENENANDDDDLKYQRFLHVAGRSPHKGTWTILQAWLQNPHWPKLTITSYDNQMVDTVKDQIFQQLNIQQLPANMEHINTKLSQDKLDQLMHSHGVHLCLSGMEGFGHYLNEARAVGALILTTNHPAMNEMIRHDNNDDKTGILLEPTNLLDWTNGLKFGNVGAPELVRVINDVVLPMPIAIRKEYGRRAQEAYVADRTKFQNQMTKFQCFVEKCDYHHAGYHNQDPDHDHEVRKQQQSCAESCGLSLE